MSTTTTALNTRDELIEECGSRLLLVLEDMRQRPKVVCGHVAKFSR